MADGYAAWLGRGFGARPCAKPFFNFVTPPNSDALTDTDRLREGFVANQAVDLIPTVGDAFQVFQSQRNPAKARRLGLVITIAIAAILLPVRKHSRQRSVGQFSQRCRFRCRM